MKVIDLINKQYNNEDMPKHIKINRLNYIYNNNRKTYESEYGEFMSFDFTNNVLNMQVELIEEQQDIQAIEELLAIEEYEVDKTDVVLNRNKINEIIKIIKQIDREMNKVKQSDIKMIMSGIDTDKIIEETRKEMNREEK